MKAFKTKILLSLGVALSSNLWVNGQSDYLITGTTSSGKQIGDEHVFLLNNEAHFHIVNTNNQEVHFTTCTWSVEGLDLRDQKRIIVESTIGNSFHFNLDTTIINKKKLIDLKGATIEGDSSVYNRVKVVCKATTVNDTKIEFEKEVLLNILPSKPKIRFIKFSWSNPYNTQYYTGYADFMVIHPKEAQQDQTHIVVKQYDHIGYAGGYTLHPGIDQDGHFEVIFWYPFDYKCYETVQVVCRNVFGFVYSDLFIIDDAISEHASKLEHTEVNRITISPNPVRDYLTISGATEGEIQSLMILDLSGRVLTTIPFNQAPIDVSFLRNGLYNLLILGKDHCKKEVVKIIKY